MTAQQFGKMYYSHTMSAVDEELARMAAICGIKLLDPGIAERVAAGDDSVCSQPNEVAWGKLQQLIKAHFILRERSLEDVGFAQTEAIAKQIRERFAGRFGLGGPDAKPK
jgi:hypothetical protein